MSQGVKQTAIDKRLYEAYKAIKPTNLVAAPTYTNAAMQAPYVPAAWPVRAGADSHFNHASMGMGAQIVRAI